MGCCEALGVSFLFAELRGTGGVKLKECSHHVHYLSPPLLELRNLAEEILDVDDVAQDFASGLAEPPELCQPRHFVSLFLTPMLYKADVREELRVVRRQVQNVEDVGECLEEYHLHWTFPVLSQPLNDLDDGRDLDAKPHHFPGQRALLC